MVQVLIFSLFVGFFGAEVSAQDKAPVPPTAEVSTAWPVVNGLPNLVGARILAAEEAIAALQLKDRSVVIATANLEAAVKEGQKRKVSMALDELDEARLANKLIPSLEAIDHASLAFLSLVLQKEVSPEQIDQFAAWRKTAYVKLVSPDSEAAHTVHLDLYKKALGIVYARK